MNADGRVWSDLVEAGIVAGPVPPAADRSPWYVRALLGIGGWLAAGFLVAFSAVALQDLTDTASSRAATGLVAVGAATAAVVLRGSNVFIAQLALAVSFAGQFLVCFSIVEGVDGGVLQGALIALFEGALAWAVPHAVHRVFCAAAAAVAAAVALTLAGAYAVAPGLLAAAVAAIWLTELRWAARGSTVRPIAYGLTLAFIVVQASWLGQQLLYDAMSSTTVQWAPRWLASILCAGVLVAVVARLSGGRAPVAIGAAAVVGAAAFDAPGIPTMLMLALVAFAHGNVTLGALAAAALIGYTSGYYYLLDTTLLQKSISLALVGTVLLLVRQVLRRWLLPEASDAAA